MTQPLFLALLKREKLPAPEVEYRFHPTRKWRFDYGWPEYMVALEVEGGVWVRGRHNRGTGYLKDLEKYNEAAVMGWRLIRVTPGQLCDLTTIQTIKRALEAVK